MKKNIHPQIHSECVVSCVCGNKFTTISTLASISVDICSNCHPFFTGQQKFVDAEGRIEKFAKKIKRIETQKAKHEEIKQSKAPKSATTTGSKNSPTLKEIMKQVQETEKIINNDIKEPADSSEQKNSQ